MARSQSQRQRGRGRRPRNRRPRHGKIEQLLQQAKSATQVTALKEEDLLDIGEVRDAFHGTSEANAGRIVRERRFEQSAAGELGPGVYFVVGDWVHACHWASQECGRRAAVVRATVKLGRCLHFNLIEDKILAVEQELGARSRGHVSRKTLMAVLLIRWRRASESGGAFPDTIRHVRRRRLRFPDGRNIVRDVCDLNVLSEGNIGDVELWRYEADRVWGEGTHGAQSAETDGRGDVGRAGH